MGKKVPESQELKNFGNSLPDNQDFYVVKLKLFLLFIEQFVEAVFKIRSLGLANL